MSGRLFFTISAFLVVAQIDGIPHHWFIDDEAVVAAVRLAPLVLLAALAAAARLTRRADRMDPMKAERTTAGWYFRSVFFGATIGGVLAGSLTLEFALSFWLRVPIVFAVGLFADESVDWLSRRWASILNRLFGRVLPPGDPPPRREP